MEQMNESQWEKAWEIFSGLWKKDHKAASDNANACPGEWETFLTLRRALKPQQNDTYDVRKAWRKVEGRIEERKTRWTGIWKYAAMFMVALGTAFYFSFHTADRPDLSVGPEVSSIFPGGQKAELFLAGGEHIILDSSVIPEKFKVSGIALIKDQENGKLHYQASSPDTTAEEALNRLNVPKGGEYSMFLADGSEVWINSESVLHFPVQFSAEKREVWLKGEAFFKVKKNPDCPFIVHVGGFDVTVLGTTFNVCAYEGDVRWQTTLVEGKVQIADVQGELILQPSHQYVLHPRTGEREVEEVDTELYTSWVNGKFYFSAYTFEEIVQKLERWYDFTMVYTDESIRKKRFSGAINRDRPLEEILRHLESISELRFNILEKEITVSVN